MTKIKKSDLPTLRKLMDDEGIWRMEGEKGVENLNTLAELLGYEEDGFLYGSPLERFLGDNPGACEALVEWIDENADCYPNVLGDNDEDVSEDEEVLP